MGTKSVKVSEAHHRCLKMASAEFGVSLQQYLGTILELSFSEDKEIRKARAAFFHAIGERFEQTLEAVKRDHLDE